jgi:hypothetical protein
MPFESARPSGSTAGHFPATILGPLLGLGEGRDISARNITRAELRASPWAASRKERAGTAPQHFQQANVRLGSISDLRRCRLNVRFALDSGHRAYMAARPRCAMTGHALPPHRVIEVA